MRRPGAGKGQLGGMSDSSLEETMRFS
eukprot:COSAG06_NODE_44840_length_360_cov_0.578544_1_plen_26_part_10